MTKVLDLTLLIHDKMPVFPGAPVTRIRKQVGIEEGYELNILEYSEHTGTHVDAPSHMIPGGLSIDMLPVEHFMGKALIIDLRDLYPRKPITRERLVKEIGKHNDSIDFLLYYTGTMNYYRTEKYYKSYPFLTKEAAEYIVERQFKGIGTDAPSPDYEPYEIHKILLGNNIVIYESLYNLEKILNKTVTFLGLPLKIKHGSGSPVRAIAIL